MLNHPGGEIGWSAKKIHIGFRMLPNGQILREWNNIQNKQGRYIHFRKFIRCNGSYLSHINGQVNSGPLYFWGEWEGNSIFYPVNSNGVPTGYHVPVHSTLIHGHQNTDPYVYGEGFKYAICRQDGIMQQLNQHDLILFGSNTKNGFYLDCVFVVNNFEPAPHVRQNKANNYTPVYSEETLDRLFEYLRKPHVPNHNIRLYKSLTHAESPNYFSFVPCKKIDADPFKRLLLDRQSFPMLPHQLQGHPFHNFDGIDPIKFWNQLVKYILNYGNKDFLLGIKFDEPQNSNFSANPIKGTSINLSNGSKTC